MSVRAKIHPDIGCEYHYNKSNLKIRSLAVDILYDLYVQAQTVRVFHSNVFNHYFIILHLRIIMSEYWLILDYLSFFESN